MSGPDYMADSHFSAHAAEGWHGDLPWAAAGDAPDLAAAVVGKLFRLAPQLADLLDLGAREYGLGVARGRVLWALHDSGPVVMRALSQALGVSPRTVTGLIDGLEADGWVTRSPHPTDRRATIITLTPVAETALIRLTESYRGLTRDLLADQRGEQLREVLTVLEVVEDRLRDAVEKGLADFAANPPQLPRPAAGGRAGG
jgi:DNA-binding MarR family transcriptional regulator